MRILSTDKSYNKYSRTTTVGLKLHDHVVLAADKRATAGLYVAHKHVLKIQRISSYMAMTISGLVADAQFLVDEARALVKYHELLVGARPSVHSIASLLATLLNSYAKTMPFVVQLLLGGYDDRPRLYYIDLFGTISEENYMATGSGSPMAISVLERGYSPELSLEEAVSLAADAVKAATMRDAWSGEGVDIVIIGRDVYEHKTLLFQTSLESGSK